MKKHWLLNFVVLFLTGLIVHAQEREGLLEENKSPLIEALQKEREAMFKAGELYGERDIVTEGEGEKRTAPGYRVQIYAGSSRSDAYAEQARFKKVFKDINTYVSYEQPNYRVKVGDFTSRNQAQALMQELKKKFSTVFIFSEQVTISP